jgi:hypothetical protein
MKIVLVVSEAKFIETRLSNFRELLNKLAKTYPNID